MTTPLPTEADDPGAPIASLDDLVAYFSSAAKPRDKFRVGTEHEKFGFARSRRPLMFDGDNGIEAILEAIAADGPGWVRAQDRGRTIALFKDNASITLEPGGQLELSGAPFRTIHDTCREVGEHLQLLRRICIPRGVGFIGMGFHPTAKLDDLPLVPKSRYAVMTRYMPKVGTRGLDMMKRTCTVQANYDWADEQDMVLSYRAALVTSPLVGALFANSPFYEGKPTGAVSERLRVWADTDRLRSGYPACVLENDFGYARYTQGVLDVPMYFVRRGGVHHDVAGASFRGFLTDGITLEGNKIYATLRDWADHTTTVFPEVRLKRVLEVRSADCGPWSRICALPALYKGILYDATARNEALALMEGVTVDELSSLRADVAERGYRAQWRGEPILDRCGKLLELAQGGLGRINAKDTDGTNESRYLNTLVDGVNRGETFAERLLRLYNDKWDRNLDHLWDEVEFFHDVLLRT
jgi:glutamate--cysteine ligase